MIKYLFIVGIITATGIVNTATARQSESHEFSDTTAVYQQWIESLPDTVKNSIPADSLRHIFYNCVDTMFNMPIFEPDPDLTGRMPLLTPPKVDEKMIIPQFKNCPNKTQPLQK